MDGIMYFTGLTSGSSHLWRTDGTAAGTYLVKRIETAFSPDVSGFAAFDGAVYFTAITKDAGWALWRTDGTAEGTTLFQSGKPNKPVVVDGALYFVNVGGLWKSDGTVAGTALLSAAANDATNLTSVDGRTYFLSVGSLWKSDGTPAGTVPIRGAGSGKQSYLANVGGTLFYSDGTSLWRSDGTYVGTRQVATIADGSDAQVNMTFSGALGAALGDLLLFGAMTADGGRELRTAYASPPASPGALTLAPAAPAPAPIGGPTPAPPAGVVLTWVDRSVSESGFVVERSTTPDFASVDQFFVAADVTTYTDATAAIGDRLFYRVRTVNAGGASAASNSVTAGAPGVLSAMFRYDRPAAHRVTLAFSADVGGTLTAEDVHLRNLTSGADVAADAIALAYDGSDNTAAVTFAGGALADGRYRLTIRGADVVAAGTGLALDGDGDGVAGGDYTFDFFVLRGDVTRDATVDFNDLVVLAQHYNQVGGKAWADGDVTGDGNVDFNDLVALAQNYNASLSPAPATAAGVSESVTAAFAQATAAVRPPVAPVTAAPARPRPALVKPTPVMPVTRASGERPVPLVKPVAAVRAPSTFGSTRIKPRRVAPDVLLA
jgi:ELWxxDGT repeat protein